MTGRRTRRGLAAPALAGVLAVAVVAVLLAVPSPEAGLAVEARPALPRVSLTTQRAIRDDPKVRARVRITDRSFPSAEPEVYDGWGGIELRGQSSQSFPKKSYGLQLQSRSGSKRDASLLGMPADDDWVLYAAYNDKTLSRNVVAYETSRWMGRWAASTRFVELELNGRPRGVYVLMERVELNRARVDVPGKGLTGAYLLELTFPWQAGRKGEHFLTPVKRRPILYAEPEGDELSARERGYVQGVVGRAERALYGGRDWRRALDEGSAVDYVLLQELFRNVDGFNASTFMVKGAGRRLAMGPVWDFDLAMGNARQNNADATRGWGVRSRVWASKLHSDPAFRRALAARWAQLRRSGLRAAVLGAVDRSAAQLVDTGAAGRNFRRWPILDRRVWQNPTARGSYAAEVRALRRWLSLRVAWMDRALGARSLRAFDGVAPADAAPPADLPPG